MVRSPVRLTLLAALTAVLALAASAAAAPLPAPLPASLRDYSCDRAVNPLLRDLNVTAVMRPVAGTQAMRMRFELLSAATRYGRYRQVVASGLGRWLVPPDPKLGQQPGDVWRVSHPVVGLKDPGFYRMRVSFRWVGADGHDLAQTTLATPLCHQLELRPDLAVRSLTITPSVAQPGEDVYTAAVRNRGATGAGPFDVELTLPDGSTVTATVPWLSPHTGRHIGFIAPACSAGDTLTVTADPAAVIDDFDRTNNALSEPCPAAS